MSWQVQLANNIIKIPTNNVAIFAASDLFNSAIPLVVVLSLEELYMESSRGTDQLGGREISDLTNVIQYVSTRMGIYFKYVAKFTGNSQMLGYNLCWYRIYNIIYTFIFCLCNYHYIWDRPQYL